MIFGRVNASERKITSGCCALISPITHSQIANGLVCGLSTRNIAHALRRSSARRRSSAPPTAPASRRSRSRTDRCPGISSAGSRRTARVPSGRWRNHSGCSVTYGWSGEHWNAMSSAISMPCARAASTRRRKSSAVPSSGWIALWPPSCEPIAHGLPARRAARSSALLLSLAPGDADRMDRRQVQHVEAQLGDVGQPRLESVNVPWRAVAARSAGNISYQLLKRARRGVHRDGQRRLADGLRSGGRDSARRARSSAASSARSRRDRRACLRRPAPSPSRELCRVGAARARGGGFDDPGADCAARPRCPRASVQRSRSWRHDRK